MAIKEEELDRAFSEAAESGFGFIHDFAPELLDPLQAVAEMQPSPLDDWQIIDRNERSDTLLMLQSLLLTHTTKLDPSSNLDFIHVKHRVGGYTHWHRDITDDNLAGSGYEKGRFRAGFNLFGAVELGFELEHGHRRQQEVITPGTLYVMDYTHNTYHGSSPHPAKTQPTAKPERSNVLLLTDVARYSTSS
ncbi:MAG TPA: hypothetical protein VLE69_02355 [Candidatus Saccharimonadales bacterium]|nr:hypothetical protein [Candidatus Saccharimonadales bacterium]